MKIKWMIPLIAAMSVSCSAAEKNIHNNPVEVGYVDWQRNYSEAVKDAKKTDKPLLVLFQEVPG